MSEIKFKESESILRPSATPRIMLGTLTTTSFATLFAHSVCMYKDFPKSYVFNMFRGSFVFSLLYFSINESLFCASRYFNVYSNYWSNYSIAAYLCSKLHYRYLIRHNYLKWHEAILYSHKLFLTLCVASLFIEAFLQFIRTLHLRPSFEDRFLNKTDGEISRIYLDDSPAVMLIKDRKFERKMRKIVKKGIYVDLIDLHLIKD